MMHAEEISAKIQKNILNIVVLLALAFVAYKIFDAGQKQVAAIKAEAETERQKNDVLMQISQSEKRLKNLRRLINNKDENAFLPALNTIAKDNQVKIIVIKPLPLQQKTSGYVRHQFSLNVALDNYHTLGKFISALESHPFMFTIERMSVNPDQGAQSKRYKLQVALDVSAILIKD